MGNFDGKIGHRHHIITHKLSLFFLLLLLLSHHNYNDILVCYLQISLKKQFFFGVS